MIIVREVPASRALSKSGLPELDYSLNPYLGCLHACRYCFAVDMTSDKDARENWGHSVVVRSNIVEVLRREMSRMPRGIVGMSTITDPYQAVEGRYRLSRESLAVLLQNGFRVTIQTKSPLVRRDADILSSHRSTCDVGMTLTSLSGDKSAVIEPGAPSPASRVRALEELSSEKIRTWIFYGPIIRGFNDDRETAESIMEIAVSTGSRVIFDRFSPYRTAMIMMRESGFPVESLRSGMSWWKSVSGMIGEEALRKSVRINSQNEEYMNTPMSGQSRLF